MAIVQRALDEVRLGPGLREGVHVHKGRARESLHRWERNSRVGHDFVDDARSPTLTLLPLQDIAPDLPVKRSSSGLTESEARCCAAWIRPRNAPDPFAISGYRGERKCPNNGTLI